MTANILDGKALAETIRAEVATGVAEIKEKHGVTPGLAAVLVGDDPASAIYVRNKRRACDEVGMFSETFELPADAAQDHVLKCVQDLNKDSRFHGILVQLPLPPQVDERSIIEAIDPNKDVDGIHPFNVGKLVQGRPDFVPGTPAGIQQILVRNGHDPAGANVVVCGRSDIVGKPMALLLMQRGAGANATVTVCHTGTKNMAEITREADILVAAIGKANVITADMVKEGAVVIDVGINRVDDETRKRGYRLEGDVDFGPVSEKAAAITPVPGGVGPMTIAMLLVNTVTAARISIHGRPS
ncbi:MAG TPA: bifunctional methylenetetrahydrofolate dehydrogenase/methenyltetrahydrofolate cyclohydrolase FolD [Dehalococcoidia bacterium]|nr:bifunctional methylenetetrahydrofolate dehydrogenase/methenyltetrahydrofolate cyclohydrolase FolD [Chloroflexota bacterium]MQF96160.1 bifunctional methylenetetrahydrofolate dehydrogenase/methenyltetrahydrofolate cyclohydrolase FolD [SAR202 cluster bacterium]HAA95098.1 bifunctional methylenetetrahydrofolate dehydrogenase/methenyltetrahydrofolate cyclohydrolase FolD [Dehalococcoidia bacterium]HCL25496.1 bifunctional methylenetetrahydrofolate dehydrogenase/methenyltetrahydrofolate cyclohydrolase